MQRSFLSFLFLVLFSAPQALYSQAIDPFGPNNYFKSATPLLVDSFAVDTLDATDIDIVNFHLPACKAYRVFFGFQDTTNSTLSILQYALYNSLDTVNALYSGLANKMWNRSFSLNGQGDYYLKVQALVPEEVKMYGIILLTDTNDTDECNNAAAEAISLPLNSDREFKLNGMLPNGKPDEDWFAVEVPRCGILSVHVLGAAANQRLVLSVLDNQLQTVFQDTAVVAGETVFTNALVESGKFYIRISETGNGPVDHFISSPLMLSLSFDSTEIAECNNRFEQAYPIELDKAFKARLYGVDYRQSEQVWDQDYFTIPTTGCGVLNLSFTDVPADQALVVTLYNAQKQQIDYAVAGCHGCNVFLSTLTNGQAVYIKVTEYNGCCTGNNAVYNLSKLPFTILGSMDTSDVYECNDIFSSATVIDRNDTVQFKIFGRNSANRLGDADRDIFKLYSRECSELVLTVDQIPSGFDLKAGIYADSIHINNPMTEAVSKGPDSLKLTVQLAADQSYYLIFQEDGNNAYSNQFIRARFNWTNKGPATPVISLIGNTGLCPGDSVILVSSELMNNRWSTGDTTQSIVVKAPGTYRDTLLGAGTCYALSEPVVVSAMGDPVADFAFARFDETLVFSNQSIDGVNYTWDFGDGNQSSDENPSHRYSTAGSFEVSLIAENPCGSDTVRKQVQSVTSIESLKNQPVSVYPQPSDGRFMLQFPAGTPSKLSCQISDIFGRIVYSGTTDLQGGMQVDLPSGLYFLILVKDGHQNKIPLVIQHH